MLEKLKNIMDKFKRGFRSIFPVLFVLALAGFFVVGVYAASTIGTNMSTTGTMTVAPAADSATSVRFQNTAGTNVFITDSTNMRVGVLGAPQTTFEVQGTASASYLMTANSLQVAGPTSVAYSRFGTGTTGNTSEWDAANDLLITGSLEVDGKASLASNFQMSGRFVADTAASHSMAGDLILTSALTVGATTASSSAGKGYTAEFVGPATGTASFYFGGAAASTAGTCIQLKSTTGAWIYMRFNQGATTPTLSTVRCH
ncbi:MAG: hypothetical protein A2816_02815 [Candidatus Yanofskybacteria bacterium RIFCSPHIGHO2_01_FULL_39_44]|nr:MAG: hypothetical protein A2816_02815 [Candidatus Yanofskybacteria bacterium RIFCSPHIGHO2_01_FULL_39_44]OGN20559.1 MAG: hypothetical protein A2910_01725 [Candidatus Yanofskybacteria bacterium RIFCSPLOWO2_01_FULL_39_28]